MMIEILGEITNWPAAAVEISKIVAGTLAGIAFLYFICRMVTNA